ncbi:MAG: tRNA 4-thiouridine(8) synthase ThiI [Spirochaetaceae bacterium]|nr:MAG: tRNA 4-thiouridine(8) synthase ThiI [Spirochaetaceae bacterium]
MELLYLIKYGELSLKGKNRKDFEARLREDIRTRLADLSIRLRQEWGRMYLHPPGGDPAAQSLGKIESTLARTFGIIGFARSYAVAQSMDQIEEAALILAEELIASRGIRFKIEARRSDKSFSLSSYQICCHLGDSLSRHFPELKVDLNRPDWTIQVEVRRRVYIYGPQSRAPGGLPLGASGRGLLLLSGGIDSPVAGYLMGKRGLAMDAVYYHTPPYTSEQAREKVQQLAGILAEYVTGLHLWIVPFTEIQLKINNLARKEATTLLVRAAMMAIADRLARRHGHDCLVTGESLGQVASQTVQSLHFTGSYTGLPLFRPLIGMDKAEIIRAAQEIGTYETSILPYQDCCTLFAPQHPEVRPRIDRMVSVFRSLALEKLISKAVDESELSIAGRAL